MTRKNGVAYQALPPPKSGVQRSSLAIIARARRGEPGDEARCYSVRLSFTVTHLLFVMLLKLVLSEVNQVVTLLALMVTVLLSFSDNL